MFLCTLQADPALTAYSRDMITSAAKQLHAAKMAVFDERSGNLFVTELGRVASHFYIRCGCLGFSYATSGGWLRLLMATSS